MAYLEEAQVEIVTVDYFSEVRYGYNHGLAIASADEAPERTNFDRVVLTRQPPGDHLRWRSALRIDPGGAFPGTRVAAVESHDRQHLLPARDHRDLVPQLTARLGKSESTIHRAILAFRESGRLTRIGPAKGGHWKVIE